MRPTEEQIHILREIKASYRHELETIHTGFNRSVGTKIWKYWNSFNVNYIAAAEVETLHRNAGTIPTWKELHNAIILPRG